MKNNAKYFSLETIIKEHLEKIKSITIETTYDDTYTKTFTVSPISTPIYRYMSLTYTMKLFPLNYNDIIEEEEEEPDTLFYKSSEDMIQSINTYIQEEFEKEEITEFKVEIEPDIISYGYPIYGDGKLLLRKIEAPRK